MESPLLMQATLALAASFWSSSLSFPFRSIEQEGLNQKGQAMAAIRTYLSTRVAGDRVKNEILAGMGALANVEVSLPVYSHASDRKVRAPTRAAILMQHLI